MSALPQRTRILVKDLLFQAKYRLSHSQTDLMAYLVNVIYWATTIDGYFVIATSKIMSDLPEMGKKTIEANIKVLKDLGLIECKIVEVTQWRGKPKLRGMKLTKKGEEYNATLVLPNQDKRVIALEKENKELKKDNIELQNDKKELQKTIERLTVSESEASAPNEPKSETARPNPSTPSMPEENEVETLTLEVTKRFGKSSQPICNFVPNWMNETIFYINSYNKLSIITPNGEYKQLINPVQVNRFWQWLFEHQNRVGKVIDFTKPLDLKALKERYLGVEIVLANQNFLIEDLVAVENGVKIKMRNRTNNKVGFAMDSKTRKEAVFALDYCEKVILGCLKKVSYGN